MVAMIRTIRCLCVFAVVRVCILLLQAIAAVGVGWVLYAGFGFEWGIASFCSFLGIVTVFAIMDLRGARREMRQAREVPDRDVS